MEFVVLGIITIFGVILVIRPKPFASGLEKFYSKYPLVRLAPEKQHKTRNGFIIALGIVFIVVGIVGFVIYM